MTQPAAPAPSPHRALAHRFIDGLGGISSPALSPDGSQVAFVVVRASVEANEYHSEVWLGPTDASRPPRPLTTGPHDGSPRWSPDGRSLAFTSRRGSTKRDTTIHTIPVDGPGEVRTVAALPDAVSALEWSPDGRWLGFVARVPDERYSHDEPKWQSPRKIETFLTRLDGEGWVFDRPNHVHVVASDGSAAPLDLTPGPHQHESLSWLPNSEGIVTVANRHDDWDRDLASHLHLVPVPLAPSRDEGVDVRQLTAGSLHCAQPSVSPDGSAVAFLGCDDSTTYPQNLRVGVLDLASGDRRWVSEGLDRTFAPLPGVRAPIWLDDHTLLTSAEDRGRVHLYRVAADGQGGSPIAVTDGDRCLPSFDAVAGAGGEVIVLVENQVSQPGRLLVRRDDEDTVLCDPWSVYLAQASPTGWEQFTVPCADGTGEIDAWIIRPEAPSSGTRLPVLLNVHGGPHTQYGETYFDEAQMQVAAGFVVIMCNPRGSSGREQTWGQAILGPKHHAAPGTGWGGADVDDVMAVLDAALERFDICDPERVGMLGGSYGGWMATELAGRFGSRFRAICSERAVNNLVSEEWSSDIATTFRTEIGPDHLSDPDEYLRMSPVRRVHDIHTPMLLIHSEDDLRCPIVQAEELFVALRTLRRDVTFYRFPGEGHELSRSGSPLHRVQRAEIILDFFTERLMLAASQGSDQ